MRYGRLLLLLSALFVFPAWAEPGFFELLTSVNPEAVKAVATEHLWLALLLCFASGILTSFTPCVYPMIPITINIFGRVSQKHASQTVKGFNPKSFSMAIVYVAGMCFTYSLLGLVSGLTGSLFGQLLQSSFMLGLLTLLFLVLALGQFGLFKMSLPASWQTKLTSVGNTDSKIGLFVMGIFSGLIVSPCVGPIIAGILAFVFESSNALLGSLYFFSFSLGLGMLFLLIGGFSGIISQLPRSGKWMIRVNQFLAVLLLIASGYYGLLWMKQVGILERSFSPANTTEISWLSSEKEALALQKQKKLPMIVDFTAEWCEACHEIEYEVFNKPQAAEQLRQFITVRIDVTEQSEQNSAILRKYGVMSLPTVVFLDARGQILDQPRVHGVIPIERFLSLLERVKNK